MVVSMDELLAVAQALANTPAASKGTSASDVPLPKKILANDRLPMKISVYDRVPLKVVVDEAWYQEGSRMVQIPPPPGLTPLPIGKEVQEAPAAPENTTVWAYLEYKDRAKKAKPRKGAAARPVKQAPLSPGLVSASDAKQWGSDSASTAESSNADNASVGASTTTVAAPTSENDPDSPVSSQARKKVCKRHVCSFVFIVSGKRLEEFGVVPRLIGINGANMKNIAEACDAKVRIRGRGSRHLEGRMRKEANLPLQVALSCPTEEGFLKAKEMIQELLAEIGTAFSSECQKMHVRPPQRLYTVVEPDERT